MSEPTYYDFLQRTHGFFLNDGVYNELINYEYYAGDEIHTNNVVFKDSAYVTHDNTHVRFLNKSDIHLYDTSDINIYDSGTLTMHTSASPNARAFVVDSIGRVGIGMVHSDPHSSPVEKPGFDLHVRGTVGIEDYMYHNDDTDTYMLFGSDQTTHYVNMTGGPDLGTTQDFDEINFRVGGVDMLQMLETDTDNSIILNKGKSNVSTTIKSETNEAAIVVRGDGTEVVVNSTEQDDTNFRVSSSGTADIPEGHGPHEKSHAFFVDTQTGHVGIGKSSPDTTLHVAGSAHIDGDLWVKGVTNQIDTLVHVTSAMDIQNMGTGPALIVNQTGTQPVATFRDDGQDILYIEDLGNVGFQTGDPHTSVYINDHDGIRIPVGTTSQRPLSGAFGITGDVSTADFSDMYGTIRYNTQYQTFEGFGPGNAWGSLGGVIDIDRDTFWTALNDISGSDYPGDPDQLRAYVGNDDNPSTTNGTLMMTIDHNRTVVHKGKVGICTNTPEWPLDVVGDARLGDWYSKRTFRHNDGNYNTTDYYLLLLEYDTTCYASGEIKGFRGSASEYNRNLDFTIHTNSTSFKSTGQTEGIMVAVQGPGLNHHANGIGGFKSLTYGGKKYLALHIEAGTMYHAMNWDFQGRARFETSTNDYNFMRIVRDNQVADVADVNDHTTIDYNLYRLGKNLGIGTAGPTSILELSDPSPEITFKDTTASDRGSIEFQDGDFNFWSDYTGEGQVSGSATKHLTIKKEGNVGIGTSDPKSKFHVAQPSTTIAGEDITQGAILVGEETLGIGIDNNEIIHTGHLFNIGTYSAPENTAAPHGAIRFNPNQIEAMRIVPGGNVGIGTASPSEALEVVGVVHATVPADSNAYTRLTYGGGLTKVNGTGNNRTTQPALIMHRVGEDGSSERTVSIHSDRESYLLGGSVGIGTTDPRAELHVEGDLRLEKDTKATISFRAQTTGPTALMFRDADEGADRMTIDKIGNVGIGTTSPDHKLTIQTDSTSGLELVGQSGANQNSNSSKIIFNGLAQDNGPFIQAINIGGHGTKRLGFFATRSGGNYTTLPTESMSIRNDGRVGIGIINPSQQLDVNGSIKTTVGWFRNAQDDTGLYNEANQNHFHSSAVDTWTMNSKTGSDNLYLELKAGGYTGTTRGYLGATNAGVGILDDDKNWAVMAMTDNCVKLRVDNHDVFVAGVDQISGDYGTVETRGSGKGNWEGYSINGRAVFMNDGSDTTGLYNDVDNQWILHSTRNTSTRIYHGGVEKIRTASDGALVEGTMYINDSTNRPGLVINSGSSGDGWTSQGCLIGLGESANKAGTGTAALYLTYNGNGSSWIGTGGVDSNGKPNKGYIQFSYNQNTLYFSANPSIAGSTNWHAGNDGAGSGLDADKLDGVEGASFLRSDAADTFAGDLTSSGGARILLKKTDNNVSDHIQFYNGTTRMGEIGCEDTTWLRINQETNKNIYTPRMIRADGGFNVDNNTVIDGSGNVIGSRVSGTVANATRAENLQGYSSSSSAGNNTIVRRHSSGYIFANYFHTTPNDVTSGITRICIESNSDGYIRHATAGSVRTFLNVENGATADQSATEIRTLLKTVDGTGSAIDADLLDGLHATSFLRSGSNITVGTNSASVEGGEIALTCTSGVDTYSMDTFKDTGGIYGHGTNKWLWRVFQGTESGIITFCADTGDLVTSGFLLSDGLYVKGHGTKEYSKLVGMVINNPGTAQMQRYSSFHRPGTSNTRNEESAGIYMGQNGNNYYDVMDNCTHWFRTNGDGITGELAPSGNLSVRGDMIAYHSFSDKRLKKNITTIDSSDALDKVLKLQGVTYEWRDKSGEAKGTQIGLVAQDVEQHVPQVVSESSRIDSDKQYKRVDYDKLVPMLIESIKSQQSQIDTLKAEIVQLKQQ